MIPVGRIEHKAGVVAVTISITLLSAMYAFYFVIQKASNTEIRVWTTASKK